MDENCFSQVQNANHILQMKKHLFPQREFNCSCFDCLIIVIISTNYLVRNVALDLPPKEQLYIDSDRWDNVNSNVEISNWLIERFSSV